MMDGDRPRRPPGGSLGGAIPGERPGEKTAVDDRTRPRARPGAGPVPQAPSPDRTLPPSRPLPVRKGGVIPETSFRTPTRTQKVLSNLQREWKYTLSAASVCATFLAASVTLARAGHPFLAALAALLVVPVIFFALFVKRAPCPVCGTPILLVDIDQCGGCGEYIRVDRNRLKQVEVGFIAANPAFVLHVPIPVIPRMVFPAHGCAVCGEPVAVDEEIDIQGTPARIPHCGEHQGGVVWSLGAVSEAIPTITFRFRSFDYWKEVRNANAAHIRTGMWRAS